MNEAAWIYAHQGPWTDEMMDRYLRTYAPDDWAELQAVRAEQQAAKSAAVYFEPYQQATGEFLEYVCGRPIGGQ